MCRDSIRRSLAVRATKAELKAISKHFRRCARAILSTTNVNVFAAVFGPPAIEPEVSMTAKFFGRSGGRALQSSHSLGDGHETRSSSDRIAGSSSSRNTTHALRIFSIIRSSSISSWSFGVMMRFRKIGVEPLFN